MVHLGTMEDNMNASSPANDFNNENMNDGMRNEEKIPKVQYTIPGVLHYVQHEWAKFEMERAQWEVERAELQARIAFLQGERKGQENLKNDLVRRIKMLEYALKQERQKNHRLTHGGAADLDATDSAGHAVGDETTPSLQLPTEMDAITTQPNSNMCWREGRQLLRKYLQEIGYTDTILDVRSFRVRSLLGMGPDSGGGTGGGTHDFNGPLVTGSDHQMSSLASSRNPMSDAKLLKDVVTSDHPVLSNMIFATSSSGSASAGQSGTSAGYSGFVANSANDDLEGSDEEADATTVFSTGKENAAKDALDYTLAEEEALAEFYFLSGDEAAAKNLRNAAKAAAAGAKESGGGGGSSATSAESSATEPDWSIDYSALNKKKEMYQKEAMTKNRAPHSRLPRAELQQMITVLNGGDQLSQQQQNQQQSQQQQQQQLGAASKNSTEIGAQRAGQQQNVGAGSAQNSGDQFFVQELNAALGGRLALGDLSALSGVDEADPVTHNVNLSAKDSLRKTWSVRYTLRSHFDSVRCMAFHPVEPILLTASEDSTMKLWNFQQKSAVESPVTTVGGGGGGGTPSGGGTNGKKPAQHDLEPSCTFRGHSGPVLCMCMSPTGEYAYTGSLDGTVRCWTLPPPSVDPYDPYDPTVLVDTLRGHANSVWSVAFHSSDNRLISASSDGTLKLWEPGTPQPLSKTFTADPNEGAPTSVDFVSTDPQQAVAAFSSSNAFIYDLEVGKSVLTFENNYGTSGQINQILSHPTLPITITAHEDKIIRFFDNNSGKIIDTMVAHLDSVTCLSIDPNGLYLLSGSHDGSLRLWNLDSKTCLQEITAHRKKYDESVMAVAFHPSRPLIASAGADGLAKVFV